MKFFAMCIPLMIDKPIEEEREDKKRGKNGKWIGGEKKGKEEEGKKREKGRKIT